MTPDTSIIAKLLNVIGMHIEKVEVQGDYRNKDGTPWNYEKVIVHARPFERLRGICRFWGETLSRIRYKGHRGINMAGAKPERDS